ncbi:hypothetical protein LTR84_000945 [Exophiala bonariae]|uniref:Uncharacterized protein n=1 Tax=Exophiala bonariae TaxID=1690606 RepID=A0AAV9NS32_9EURO|nr:hypothetical protein LTR84_000945 [Exophiala bonariae]
MPIIISKLLDIIASNGSLISPSAGNGEKEEAAKREVIKAANALIFALERPGDYLARVGWGEPSRTAALRTAFELGILAKLDMRTPKTSA